MSASLVGIDKSRQNGHNFVEMCQKWFSSDNGTNLYCNNPSSDRSWERIMDWYASLPNMLAFQLNDLYRNFYLHILKFAQTYAFSPKSKTVEC